MLGLAQTGTGKTAAFMLPSIDRLRASGNPTPRKSCRMLVLAPTRELAGQIATSAKEYGALSGLVVASIVGGTSVNKDRARMARGVDILVATPGRLVDLLDQRAMDLSAVETIVLDEADQMLDLGFIHALKKIVSLLPKQRQTLLFSATMPGSIRKLAEQYLDNPVQVSVAPAATTAERVDQYVCFVNQNEKQALLTIALRKGLSTGEMDLVLVFTRTKHGADRVVKKLGQQGIEAVAIHGNKSQPQRERALALYRKGQVRVLVATDIAARGIDIPGVSHVFNFELPNVAEQYVHRIGRTARAGRAGVALAFCAPDERDYLRDIERLTKVRLGEVPLPPSFNEEVKRIGSTSPGHSGDEAMSRNQPRRKPKRVVSAKPRGEGRGEGARGEGRGERRGHGHGGGQGHGQGHGQGQAKGQGGGQRRRHRGGNGAGNGGGGNRRRAGVRAS